MRAINADALVNRIVFHTDIPSEYKEQVEDTINDMQTIEPQPHWIPCSEKLPEYRKLVDVTTRDLRIKLAYLDSIKEDGTDDLWIIPLEDAECALWNIVAWKPRPEPWKGDK